MSGRIQVKVMCFDKKLLTMATEIALFEQKLNKDLLWFTFCEGMLKAIVSTLLQIASDTRIESFKHFKLQCLKIDRIQYHYLKACSKFPKEK